MREYGFRMGNKREVLVKAWTEQRAVIKLIKKYWHIIKTVDSIHFLGTVVNKSRVCDLND